MAVSCAQFPRFEQAQESGQAQPNEQTSTVAADMPPMEPQENPASPRLWQWNGEGRRVSHIWIDVDAQRARFYEGVEQIGWTTVASGLESHPTPTGRFEIIEKTTKKRSNLYGKIFNASGRVIKSDAKKGRDAVPAGGRFVGAKMPYFMRLTYDGIGMHAGPIPVPGFRASHGCIRMPGEFAPLVFRHVSLGTPVTVTGDGPHYGDYAAREQAARTAKGDLPAPLIQAATTEGAPPAVADAL
jgi:hypothetical protein